MQEYQGVVTELGASTTLINKTGSSAVTTYPYIEVGGQTVRKVRAFPGIRSKLEAALQSGAPVSVFVQSGYLCGVKMGDGRVFAAHGNSLAVDLITTVFVLATALVLSAFLVGLPILLWGMWHFWGVWSFRMATASLADAIVV